MPHPDRLDTPTVVPALEPAWDRPGDPWPEERWELTESPQRGVGDFSIGTDGAYISVSVPGYRVGLTRSEAFALANAMADAAEHAPPDSHGMAPGGTGSICPTCGGSRRV
jgi:hypothetical protein